MSINRLTVLACVASLTLSFSALLGQCPVKSQQSECCQKASSQAQPPVQDPALQKSCQGKTVEVDSAQKSCQGKTVEVDSAQKSCQGKTTLVDSAQKGPAKQSIVKLSTALAGQLNSKCYFSKKTLTADSPLLAYNGFAIRVCCKGCIGKFAKLTSQKKDTWIAGLVSSTNKSCPFSDCPLSKGKAGNKTGKNPHSVTFHGKVVKLCGDDCLASWNKAESKTRAHVMSKLPLTAAPTKDCPHGCRGKSLETSIKTSIETSIETSDKNASSAPSCDSSKSAQCPKSVSK